jgi:hypothetical protein
MDFDIKDKTIGLVGKRGSGKSQMLHYIVKNNKKSFQKIFVICPTEIITSFYTDITPKENIFFEYKEDWVESLITKLMEINKGKTKHNAHRVLLILDDCTGDTNFHQSPSLKKVFVRARHFFLTLILTSQYLFGNGGVPPVCRNNFDFLLVNKINGQSLECLSKEFRVGDISKEDFYAMYSENTGNYGFLLINNVSSEENDNLDAIYGVLRVPANFIKK